MAKQFSSDREPEKRIPKYAAHFDLIGKGGYKRDLARADLFLPFVQTDDLLVFLDLRGMGDLDETYEFNAGLGIRTCFKHWIFGRYVFYDWKRSQHGNDFHQFTGGLEFLWENFDLRTNLYLPGSAEKTVDAATTTGIATMVGNQIYLDSITATVERALRGVDAEAGLRIPIPGIDLRAYAGGYHFFAPHYESVTGPRARVEMKIDLPFDSELALGVEGQWDSVRHKQGFATARLRIPLGLGSWKRTRPTLSRIERRMTTPIVRDVDIISSVRAGRPVQELAALNVYGGSYTDFSMIDATAVGAAAGDLNAAIASLGEGATFLLDGSQGDFDILEPIQLQQNQSMLGAGPGMALVGTVTGVRIPYDTGASPTITNDRDANAIEMEDGATVAGIRIDHTTDANTAVISVSGKRDVSIVENTIIASGSSSTAVRINSDDCTDCTGTTSVRGNTIVVQGGLAVSATQDNSPQNVSITGNDITSAASSTVIWVDSHGGSGAIDISGNTIVATETDAQDRYGIFATGDASITIQNNSISMADGHGIAADKYSSGTLSIKGNNVTATNSSANVYCVAIDAWADATALAEISNNSIAPTTATGIRLVSAGGDTSISGNNVTTDGQIGIDVTTTSTHAGVLILSNNRVVTTGDSSDAAVWIDSYGESDDMSVSQNTIVTSGAGSYGVYMYRDWHEDDSSWLSVFQNSITTTGAGADGVHLLEDWYYIPTSSIVDSTNVINVSGEDAEEIWRLWWW